MNTSDVKTTVEETIEPPKPPSEKTARWLRAEPIGPAVIDAPIPFLALRSSVVFPGTRATLDIGRTESRAAVEVAAASASRLIVLGVQDDPATESPRLEDILRVATLAQVEKAFEPTTPRSVTVIGLRRIRLRALGEKNPFARVEKGEMEEILQREIGLPAGLKEGVRSLLGYFPEIPPDSGDALATIDDAGSFCDALACALGEAFVFDIDLRKRLLGEGDVSRRLVVVETQISKLQAKLMQGIPS